MSLIEADRFLELGFECARPRGKRILALTTRVPKDGFRQKGIADLQNVAEKKKEKNSGEHRAEIYSIHAGLPIQRVTS
ncbi:MAG: hypothetical protein KGR46_12235 [Verrucomicrobia bacterium]|nr:hypothetical protein [Verrucomicrobiota bacterium]